MNDCLFQHLLLYSVSDVVFKIVERAHKDQDHLFVELDDVIPHEEDDCTKLTGDGDCVSAILLLILVSLSWCDNILVYNSRFD